MHAAALTSAAALAHEVDRSLHRSPGRQQIIEDDDPLTRRNRVLLDLDGVGPIFEIVGETSGSPGSLPCLRTIANPRPSS